MVSGPLSQAVEEYLTVKRALGFKLDRSGALLRQFAAFSEHAGVQTITVDLAMEWACSPTGAAVEWWSARLAAVRVFARWHAAFDPAAEVPPADVLPQRSRRAEPYPFTGADIAAMMRATAAIPTPLRAATYRTLIGLLAVTGLRVGEALALDRSDVDLVDGVLTVREAKFGKSREVPLHPSTVAALADYARARERWIPDPRTAAFFVSTTGTRLIYKNVHHTWLALSQHAGLAPLSPRCRPRPHDLRHRFAVTTLIGWYRDGGGDVAARLPQLSTYLGHRTPASTYWYLHAAPELLALAADRLDGQLQS